MTISGIVQEIIFRNDENGYTICNVLTDKVFITCVGIFPSVHIGQSVELTGEFIEDKRYGRQFKIESVKVTQPSSEIALKKHLSSGIFPGIGVITAERIVDKFGIDTLDIIKRQPQKLTEIRGMTLKKAMIISEIALENEVQHEIVLELSKLGFSTNMSFKIYKCYQNRALDVIKENPYQLIEDIDGIGFSTADKIAEKIGIEKNSKFRVQAGILYTLKLASGGDGHTFLPADKLFEQTIEILNLDSVGKTVYKEVLTDLEVMGKIVELPKDGAICYMQAVHFYTERAIARSLIKLSHNAEQFNLNLSADIKAFEDFHGVTLHKGQVDAITKSVNCGVSVITGGPGTGKTTIIKAILKVLDNLGKTAFLCAPTGRAAKRLSEATDTNAKTIHRMLQVEDIGCFNYNSTNPLPCDVVICDEASMCDIFIFDSLVSAIKLGGRLIIVGDKDQLPSVGAGNVLADIIDSDMLPVSYLTEIYRQDANSLIAENAHRINKGIMPIIDNKSSDFFVFNSSSPADAARTINELVATRVTKFCGADPSVIQVLCPMKKGQQGVEELNKSLQYNLNPPSTFKNEIKIGDTVFRAGDRVIHTKNNYQLKWRKPDTGEADMGIFNGDIGIIENVDMPNRTIDVTFEDGRIAQYTSKENDELALSYALSVHKSQGSEFDIVIVSVMSGSYKILTRNLLYTAVTRAKKMVILVGARENIRKMVENNYSEKRYSMLSDFLIYEENHY